MTNFTIKNQDDHKFIFSVHSFMIVLDSLMSNATNPKKWCIYSDLKTMLANSELKFDEIVEDERE